jgi:hypothetical protein
VQDIVENVHRPAATGCIGWVQPTHLIRSILSSLGVILVRNYFRRLSDTAWIVRSADEENIFWCFAVACFACLQ